MLRKHSLDRITRLRICRGRQKRGNQFEQYLGYY